MANFLPINIFRLLTVVFELGDVTSKIWEFWFPSTLKVTVVVTIKLLGSCPSIGVGGVELFGVAGLDHRGGGAGGVLRTQIIFVMIQRKTLHMLSTHIP